MAELPELDTSAARIKTYSGPVEIAKADDGDAYEVTAVFATLGVVDKDGDIIEAGSVGEQDVMILPAHDTREVPLGKGRTLEQGDEAKCRMKFNADVAKGREWYKAIKFDAEEGETSIQEWSFGFRVLEWERRDIQVSDQLTRTVYALKKLDISEVSPVHKGAGVNTHTESVKSETPEEREAAPALPQGIGDSVELAYALASGG